MSDFESKFRAFIDAVDDRNDEEWRKILATEGFLTPETLLATSKRMVNEREPYEGTHLWKIADAIIDVVGTEAEVWAGPTPLSSPSSVWIGAAAASNNFVYMHGSDIRAMTVFAMRLSDDCFSVLDVLADHYSSHCHSPTPPDDEWVDYLTQRGISRKEAMSGYPRHDKAELVWYRIKAVFSDRDLLEARLSGLAMGRITRRVLSLFVRECPDNVLHANKHDSFASKIFEVDPSVFGYALVTRPDLLHGHRFDLPMCVLEAFFLGELTYRLEDEDSFSAILSAVANARLNGLYWKMRAAHSKAKYLRQAAGTFSARHTWARRLTILDDLVCLRNELPVE